MAGVGMAHLRRPARPGTPLESRQVLEHGWGGSRYFDRRRPPLANRRAGVRWKDENEMTTQLLDQSKTCEPHRIRTNSDDESKYLTFKLADEEFGLEILKVREIIAGEQIDSPPAMSAGADTSFMLGMGKVGD